MPRVTDPAATTVANFAQIRREHSGVFFDAPALISRWRVTIVGQAVPFLDVARAVWFSQLMR